MLTRAVPVLAAGLLVCAGLAGCSTSATTGGDAAVAVDGGGGGDDGGAPDLGPVRWNGWWERLGPWNFYDELNDNGAAGTVADAVADPDTAGTLYVGGSNNGAASGVWKSTDGGKRWFPASSGLGDPRIYALHMEPTRRALLAGTPSGIFRSPDRANTWTLEPGTAALGNVRYFAQTPGSPPGPLLAASDAGLAWLDGTGWHTSPAPGGPGLYILSRSAATGPAYAVGGPSAVYRIDLGALAGGGAPVWTATAMHANTVSVDPSNPQHVLGTHPGTGSLDDYTIIESTDGGATSRVLSRNQAWYVAFDPDDATGKRVWCAGQGGALHSEDGGKTWTQTSWASDSREGYQHVTTGFDIQRIVFGFAGAVAFASDQGLVRYDGNDTLVSLSGDLRVGIVVSVSVSRSATGEPRVLTTNWDWGPTASWDGGRTWAATSWYGSEYWSGDGSGAPIMGEGGQVFALGASADGKPHAVMHDGGLGLWWSDDGGRHFTGASLPADGVDGAIIRYNAFAPATDKSGVATGTLFLLADVGGNTRIYRSTDHGASWRPDGARLGAPAHMTLAFEAGADRLWLGSEGTVASSSDGGVSFGAIQIVCGAGAIVRLLARPHPPGAERRLVALCDDGRLITTADGGSTWSPSGDPTLTAALAATSPGTWQLGYSPSGHTLVFAGGGQQPGRTAAHILASRDDGATWTDETHDARTVQYNGLAWDGADLYLATSGEGLLRRQAFER